jgi:hypothetical protein
MIMLNNMKKTINIMKNNIINVDNKLSTVSKISINKKPKTINLDYINNRIDSEICENTINKLKETYLLNEYKECKNEINKTSVKINENIEKLKSLKINFNNIIDPKNISKPELIDEFDSIYRETIDIIKLNNKKLEICINKNVSHKRYMIDILLKNQQIK